MGVPEPGERRENKPPTLPQGRGEERRIAEGRGKDVGAAQGERKGSRGVVKKGREEVKRDRRVVEEKYKRSSSVIGATNIFTTGIL